MDIKESLLFVCQGLGSTAKMASWKEYYALRRLPLESPVGSPAPRIVHLGFCLVQLHSKTHSSRRYRCMHRAARATQTVLLTLQPWS